MKAATALSKRDDDVATLKADMGIVKWMLGILMTMTTAILFKLFTH